MMKSVVLFLLASLAFVSCKSGDGKKTSPHGYEYVHHIQNSGAKPQPGDEVSFSIAVLKNDSLIFPGPGVTQTMKLVIPDPKTVEKYDPRLEGLLLMTKGDSLTIFQKMDTFSNLPPNWNKTDVLGLRLAVKEIKGKAEVEKEQQAAMEEAMKSREAGTQVAEMMKSALARYKSGEMKPKLKSADKGLEYVLLMEGDGPMPKEGETVKVHYYGFLMDGSSFDNSFERGMPFEFALKRGQVIEGWDIGISQLKGGSEAILFIPAELGYGATGAPPRIPANAKLAFYVKLMK